MTIRPNANAALDKMQTDAGAPPVACPKCHGAGWTHTIVMDTNSGGITSKRCDCATPPREEGAYTVNRTPRASVAASDDLYSAAGALIAAYNYQRPDTEKDAAWTALCRAYRAAAPRADATRVVAPVAPCERSRDWVGRFVEAVHVTGRAMATDYASGKYNTPEDYQDDIEASVAHFIARLNGSLEVAQPHPDAAARDAARLDWLEAEHRRFDPVAALTVKYKLNRNASEWVNVAGSVRDALDAAMRASDAGGER